MDLFGGLSGVRAVTDKWCPIAVTVHRPGRASALVGARATILTGLYAPEPPRPGQHAWFRNRGFGSSPFTTDKE